MITYMRFHRIDVYQSVILDNGDHKLSFNDRDCTIYKIGSDYFLTSIKTANQAIVHATNVSFGVPYKDDVAALFRGAKSMAAEEDRQAVIAGCSSESTQPKSLRQTAPIHKRSGKIEGGSL